MLRFTTQKQKVEQKDAVMDSARFLYQVGDLLASKRFRLWVEQAEARFAWATPKLQEKLVKEMMFQIEQAFPVAVSREQTRASAFVDLAELCRTVAASYEAEMGDTVRQKDKRFIVRQGQCVSQVIIQFLSRKSIRDLYRDRKQNFYLWNALDALELHVRCRDTLENDTGNLDFERFLKGLKESYMLEGYPKDILAHDAHAIRQRKPVKALLVRDEYCSTWIVDQGEPITPMGGFQVLDIRQAA